MSDLRHDFARAFLEQVSDLGIIWADWDFEFEVSNHSPTLLKFKVTFRPSGWDVRDRIVQVIPAIDMSPSLASTIGKHLADVFIANKSGDNGDPVKRVKEFVPYRGRKKIT